MYFKKLELFGFKSFADKTVLNFEPGVTAIVGPNGTGKSNIADSIKWVLGEQSARAMRSTKMEDVIFNGTDTKDAVSMAEVSLTFLNPSRKLPIDEDEVCVTRKVFRSGESEYYLNKERVRLKDMQDVFAGTGIGSNSYSHIEQGKMDQVLSSKPEERRYVFEEASGITKFKAKKKEALLKLEHTENNLVRIGDIISEVKRQIGSIERQAAKAKRYREKFDILKDLEIKTAVHERTKLSSTREAAAENLGSFKDKEKSESERLSSMKANEKSLRDKVDEADSQISELQTRLLEARNTANRNLDKASLNRERITELTSRREKLEAELEAYRNAQAAVEEKLNSAKMDFEVLLKDRQGHSCLIEEKSALLEELSSGIGTSQNIIKEAKARSIDVASNQSKRRNDIAKVQADISNASARARRLRMDRDDIVKEVDGLKQRLASLNEKMLTQRKAADDAQALKNSIDADIARTTASIDELRSGIDELNHSFTSMSSKLEFLEEMKRRYQGFEEAARELLTSGDEALKSRYGLCGALSDIIRVNDKFAVAVDTALGEYVQYLVVESEDKARSAISDIKSKCSGRVGLLSLDASANDEDIPGDDLAGRNGIIGKAKDFVECDARFSSVVNKLLRDTYIVKDLDVVWNLTGRAGRRERFITVEGDVYERGVLVGGKSLADEGRSPILRDAKIRQLKDEIESVRKRLDAAKGDLAARDSALKDLRLRLNDANVSLEEERIKAANIQGELSSIGSEHGKVSEELSILNLELDELIAREKDLEESNSRLKGELDALEAEASEIESSIKLNEDMVISKSKHRETALVEIAELNTKLEGLKVLEEDRAKSLEVMENSFAQNAGAMESRRNELDASLVKADELAREISGLESEILSIEEEAKSVDSELSSFRESRRAIYAELEAIVRDASQIQDTLSDLDRKINELNAALSGVNLKEHSVSERLLEIYRIDLNTLDMNLEPGFDPEAAKSEITDLKSKLESMGSVNLVAIEEHDELKERYEFLVKQNDDLFQAKDSLKKAIDKINKTTRQMFMDTFVQIQQAFKEYYRMLFGGGNAEVILMDEHDVLECGIEIVAKPPGKKLQNISLLSGGERALTAIALLFAIFKVKPSPFCILDEIDAPLDESNIGRFNSVLNEFLKMSQFILITHNKKTITNADVMYGVTMQESGVSKMVSVKLNDSKKIEEKVAQKV